MKVEELQIKSIYENNLDMKAFASMLESPTQCYKFYWLEAILTLMPGKDELTFEEIIFEMLWEAWFTVTQYHLHLGPTILGKSENLIEHAIHEIEKDQDIKVIYKITKIMQEISNIVKYYFGISFDEESVYYYRFITHLKFFSERLINEKAYTGEEDDGLLDVIKVKYKNSYECVEKISRFIEEQYNYVLANEEKLYLTIHIEKIVSRS